MMEGKTKMCIKLNLIVIQGSLVAIFPTPLGCPFVN